MVDLDLNVPADELEGDIEPPIFTQPAGPETVGESPDPAIGANINLDDEGSGRGPHHNLNPPHPANPSVHTTTAPTTSNSHPGQAEEINEEVASTPTEPFLGMRFDTIQLARAHYNAYALRIGFSIKSNTSNRARWTNELEKQQFVCNKHRAPKTDDQKQKEKVCSVEDVSPVRLDSDVDVDGDGEDGSSKKTTGSKKSRVRRRRETIKQTKCPAKMVVKFINNKWEVINFVAEHNHPCCQKPSLAKYLRSHRGIPQEERDFLKMLHNCNLETGRMMTIMSEFYGAEGFVPYEPKDITNLRTGFRTVDQEFDIDETIAYFKELQTKDPDFFYKVSYDEENRVENIFWVDSVARKAYSEAYHDCVSFDTTFMTNHFNMPFAPFIGINRHGQSFMLGCGFMRDEKEDAFKWLFEAFLEAMGGKQPDNIITDQDRAMANAISAIFPDSVHRNCRWHIIKKANEKLGPYLGRHPGLAEDFNESIDESMSVDEFEARWAEMVQKWELAGHETFGWLKKYAHTWVPCYFRTRFFPFLQSTQRSEGFNAVLKRYVNPQNSIKHFVKQYEKIQQRILCREGHNDYRTDELEVEPKTSFPIEKHALLVYTRPIYGRFSTEFEMIGRFNVQPQGHNCYLVVPNNHRCYPYGSRSYMVNASGGNGRFSCECCKFERDGLLCCHVLKVFTHLGVDAIPEHYILRRWTQSALPTMVFPHVPGGNDEMPEKSREHLRFANLSRDFVGVAKIGCKSDQAEAIARRHIREMLTEFSQLNKVRRKKVAKKTQTPGSNTETGPPPVATQQTSSRANQPSMSARNVPPKQGSTHMAPPSGSMDGEPCRSVPKTRPYATTAHIPLPEVARTDVLSTQGSMLHQATNTMQIGPAQHMPTLFGQAHFPGHSYRSDPNQNTLAATGLSAPSVPNMRRTATREHLTQETSGKSSVLATAVGMLHQPASRMRLLHVQDTTTSTAQEDASASYASGYVAAAAGTCATSVLDMPRSARGANIIPHMSGRTDVLSMPVAKMSQTTTRRQAPPAQDMPSSLGIARVSAPSGPSSSSALSVPMSTAAINEPRAGAKRSIYGPDVSGGQRVEPMVVLNPPKSNTKGRKKARYLAGIELKPKKTNLCGTCGQPGHNSATCTAGLGNNKPDGVA